MSLSLQLLKETLTMFSLKSTHPELDKEELTFLSELGWLTALAFAVIVFATMIFG